MIRYLYVKKHPVTGLQYFGQTTNIDPLSYHGSGRLWCAHIKEYGNVGIETINLWAFDNQEECTKFAIEFSNINNIVECDKWANLKVENGKDGFLPAENHPSYGKKIPYEQRCGINNPFFGHTHTEETKRKISVKVKIIQKSGEAHHNSGRIHSDETKAKMSTAKRGITKSPLSVETKKKISIAQKGEKNHRYGKTNSIESNLLRSIALKGIPKEIVICPHCQKPGGKAAMVKWHFDKCKYNKGDVSFLV